MSCQVCHSWICKCPDTLPAAINLNERIAALEKQNAELQRLVASQQAKIDRLMLEYCPNEMTSSQLKEWSRNQKPLPEHLYSAMMDIRRKAKR